jgi:hypothetical protein
LIYINDHDELLLEQKSYIDSLKTKSSLLRLLPLFEFSIDNIIEGVIIKEYKIEDILPLNELILFLIKDMKSSYWFNLVCSFLLSDRINFKLSFEVMNSLKNQELIDWLLQREAHLVRKLVSKISRL